SLMSFASPGYLALLVLAPIVAAAYLALARWRRGAARRFAPAREDVLGAGVSARLRAARAALVVLAIAAIAVALARPQLGEEHIVIEQSGADVVIALDVSRSMFADDLAPNRLEVAQQETLDLLDRLREHRLAFVIFGGNALLRSPLTTDVSPLRALVASAPNDSALLVPGSDLGAAVRAATLALEAGDAESQAIVLITDGEDHDGDALDAAQEAASRGILLFTAGFGTDEGAPVPDIDSETGLPVPPTVVEGIEPLITRRDQELLRLMAAATPGGRYVSGEELTSLAEPIEALERTTFASERQDVPVERFQWLVVAALVLLAGEQLLPERRLEGWAFMRRLRLAPRAVAPLALLALVFVAASCASEAGDLVEEGNDAYGSARFGEALDAYQRAGAQEPGRAEPPFNAGLALHRLERYNEAVLETLRSLPIDDPELASRAHYNLGNHYVELERLEEAFASYRRALVLDPGNRDAKFNLELVLRLMDEPGVEGSPDGGRPDDDGEPDDDDGAGGGDPGDAAGAAQRALAEALGVVDEDLTVDEALRALQLAQELNRLLPLQEGRRSSGDPGQPNY
ncbi:MAG: VWA domain-containing protein, partial [Dehalococcoidia bacterium]